MGTIGKDSVAEIQNAVEEIKRLAAEAKKAGHPFAPALVVQAEFLAANFEQLKAAWIIKRLFHATG